MSWCTGSCSLRRDYEPGSGLACLPRMVGWGLPEAPRVLVGVGSCSALLGGGFCARALVETSGCHSWAPFPEPQGCFVRLPLPPLPPAPRLWRKPFQPVASGWREISVSSCFLPVPKPPLLCFKSRSPSSLCPPVLLREPGMQGWPAPLHLSWGIATQGFCFSDCPTRVEFCDT